MCYAYRWGGRLSATTPTGGIRCLLDSAARHLLISAQNDALERHGTNVSVNDKVRTLCRGGGGFGGKKKVWTSIFRQSHYPVDT